MKDNLKSFAISLILLMVGLLFVWIMYVGFIGGPARAYQREDQVYVEAMMEMKGYTNAKIINRFSFDQVYYIVEITDTKPSKLVWFNKELNQFGEHESVSYEPVYPMADNFGIHREAISLGVYKDKLVYVLKNKNFEKFVSIDTLETLYDRGSGL